jgi:hypothetical protein
MSEFCLLDDIVYSFDNIDDGVDDLEIVRLYVVTEDCKDSSILIDREKLDELITLLSNVRDNFSKEQEFDEDPLEFFNEAE